MPRAGFEPATTERVSFGDYEQFLRDLEEFKLFAKSKLNFSLSLSLVLTNANIYAFARTHTPPPACVPNVCQTISLSLARAFNLTPYYSLSAHSTLSTHVSASQSQRTRWQLFYRYVTKFEK